MAAKCVVVGASQVGKTAIVRLLCEGKATPRYQRTVGISAAHKEIELPDRAPAEQPAPRVQLHVWDKAAESNFATLDEAFFSGARAGVLVFSSTDRRSFDALRSLKRTAEKTVSLQDADATITWVLLQHKVDQLDERALRAPSAATPATTEPPASPSRGQAPDAAAAAAGSAAPGARPRPRLRSGGAEAELASGQPASPSSPVSPPARTAAEGRGSGTGSVSVAEGRQLAKDLGDLPFFHSSTETADSILPPFVALAASIYACDTAPQSAAGAGSAPPAAPDAPSTIPQVGMRFRESTVVSGAVPDDEDDDGFPVIAHNADAPCNQPFKLRKPAMQGSAGTRKVQDQFKTQIYTAVCLIATIVTISLVIFGLLSSGDAPEGIKQRIEEIKDKG